MAEFFGLMGFVVICLMVLAANRRSGDE